MHIEMKDEKTVDMTFGSNISSYSSSVL